LSEPPTGLDIYSPLTGEAHPTWAAALDERGADGAGSWSRDGGDRDGANLAYDPGEEGDHDRAQDGGENSQAEEGEEGIGEGP